jgi:putative transposase
MRAPDRRALIDRGAPSLSIRRRCALLGVARSGVYRPPRPANDNDLLLMRRIDELFTAWPFLGSRRMTALVRAEGHRVNRKRVQRLMRRMGIAALGPKPRTTKPAPGHKVFPYLLRNLAIERPNHVWAADITYVPIGRGFLYLVAIIDGVSRAVLAWRLSNTMDAAFCLAALEEALARFGKPEIFNTDPRGAMGQPIHQRGLYRHAGGGRHPHLDGRARPRDRQRVHRAAVAQPEIRGYLPQGRHRRPRGQSRDRRMADLLQSPASAPGAGKPDADGGVARRHERRARRSGCGYDAALGQRWRVAHNPTAAATTNPCRLTISGGRSGSASN